MMSCDSVFYAQICQKTPTFGLEAKADFWKDVGLPVACLSPAPIPCPTSTQDNYILQI